VSSCSRREQNSAPACAGLRRGSVDSGADYLGGCEHRMVWRTTFAAFFCGRTLASRARLARAFVKKSSFDAITSVIKEVWAAIPQETSSLTSQSDHRRTIGVRAVAVTRRPEFHRSNLGAGDAESSILGYSKASIEWLPSSVHGAWGAGWAWNPRTRGWASGNICRILRSISYQTSVAVITHAGAKRRCHSIRQGDDVRQAGVARDRISAPSSLHFSSRSSSSSPPAHRRRGVATHSDFREPRLRVARRVDAPRALGRTAGSYAACLAAAQRAVFQSCADAVCQSNA
jgi:hypothetical protein